MTLRAHGKTWVERHGPMVFALVGVAIGYFFPVLPEEKLLGAFLAALTTIGVMLASLTGVSASALLVLHTDVAEVLRKQGYYKALMSYVHWSVFGSLLLALTAVAGFVLPLEGKTALFYRTALCGLFFYALGAFHRISVLFRRIGGFFREEE